MQSLFGDRAARTLSRSAGDLYPSASRIRFYGGVYLHDTRSTEYYTHIDEVILEEDVDRRRLIARAPAPFREVARTAARIRVFHTLQIDEKSTTIDRMLDTLWEQGVDPGAALRYVEENDVDRAADYYQHWMYTMMGKQIVAAAAGRE